ncbi:MAG: ATP synthase F1 subunit delta [Bacteroidales bacterium]|nr:ATP synthase F1 subunit delta [Bacteroidales bacterium]
MSQGQISSRYATALLAFADANGEADRVCREAHRLEQAVVELPQVESLVTDPAAVPLRQKMSLLRAALEPDEMSGTMETFLRLVFRNRREHELRFILHTFTRLYYRSRGIRFATVTTAVAPPPKLADRIAASLQERLHCQVVMEEKTDPSLIGGVVVRVDDIRLDASVAGQLETLRREFTEKNKRIV